MTTKNLSKHAAQLLRFANDAGEEGLPVVGIPDQTAVNELVRAGRVRADENTAEGFGYRSRIYATEEATR